MAVGMLSVLFVLLSFLDPALCQDLSPAPAPENFVRRLGHRLVVIGDYLYIDGGEISQTVNGGLAAFGDHYSNPINDTLSISLAESWNNVSVSIKTTPKTSPAFIRSSHWVHGDSFYMWGGQASYGILPASKDLWKFTVDGAGGGSWDIVNPANRDVFMQLTRSTGASWTTCNGMGLYMGGYQSLGTDNITGLTSLSRVPVPGLLTFDTNTNTWSNRSATNFNLFGTSLFGAATCLEGLGKRGFFLPLGGNVANRVAFVDDGSGLIDMATIKFYDVAANSWYTQGTTGDAPPLRDRFCISVAQSQSKTYEVFIYGGHNGRDKTIYDDVWILSIPAFTWFKAEARGVPRNDHECITVGNQMISVGGFKSFLNFTEPDEWAQGIGVLELSTLTWADRYEPGTTYDSPQVVKDWYNSNNLNDVNWRSDDVKALFSSYEQLAPTTPGSDNSDSSEPQQHTRTRTGAIAGAAVGGAVAVVVIGLIFWLVRRHRRNRQEEVAKDQESQPEESTDYPATLQSTPSPHDKLDYPDMYENRRELGGQTTTLYALPVSQPSGPAVELDSSSVGFRRELDGAHTRQELESSPVGTELDGSPTDRVDVSPIRR
ncbi:hypothetical protein F5B20DRAFT_546182 [Whalleya microplaca]|nr:hypothetical protein F5B20DRAFT_546182 [Whalleya microplaca]